MSLSPLYAAALDLQSLCREQSWSFCFIGGLAVQRWAVERFTKDADITLMTDFIHDEEFMRVLLARFEPIREDALDFALRLRVLLLRHANGVPMDVALGATDFERRTITRASAWRREDGAELFTCCAEDLIVHKVFAARPQDWADVDNVLGVQGEKLDLDLILRELAPLAELNTRQDVMGQLRTFLKKHQLR